ncbi:hypothetical protein SEPCBS119000_002347 [Sporothrix epigloea]|uniref:Uncharacterized protein n=1 Tax=Sporothrix epigloea TaxID=1892477 RepID=A0ABP0DFQ6_9PEZI
MAYPSAPPLLLTRRLSSYLHSSLASLQEQNDQRLAGATIQTALLVTLSGKLLAYESPLPVHTLRTHCSVAASLWTIHASSSPSVAVALNQRAPVNPASAVSRSPPPTAHTPTDGYFTSPADEAQEEDPYHDGSAPVSIAASFDGGAVFVVRRLRCGLLFACSTPSPNSTTSRFAAANDTAAAPSMSDPQPAPPPPVATKSSLLPHQTLPPSTTTASSASNARQSIPTSSSTHPSTSPNAGPQLESRLEPAGSLVSAGTSGAAAGSTTEQWTDEDAGSEGDPHRKSKAYTSCNAYTDAVSSTTTETTTMADGGDKIGSVSAALAFARRQVDDLAMLLDEKLGALSVPEENIGMNGFC